MSSSPPIKKRRHSSLPPGYNQVSEGSNSDTSVLDNGVEEKPTSRDEMEDKHNDTETEQNIINKEKRCVLAKASKAVTEIAEDSIIDKGKKAESAKASQGVTETEDVLLRQILELKNVELLKENTQLEQEILKEKAENVITRQKFAGFTNSFSRKEKVGEAGSIQTDKEDIDEGKGNEAGSIQADLGFSSRVPKPKPQLITREELGACSINKGKRPASAKASKAVMETEDVALLKMKNAEFLKSIQLNQEDQELLKKSENVLMRQELENLNSLTRKDMNGRKGKEAGSIQADQKDTDEGRGNEAGTSQANPGFSSHMPKVKPLLIIREELGECRLNTEDLEVPDNGPPAEEGEVQILIPDNEQEELFEDLEDPDIPDNDWP